LDGVGVELLVGVEDEGDVDDEGDEEDGDQTALQVTNNIKSSLIATTLCRLHMHRCY
jgi:hypothetical protein